MRWLVGRMIICPIVGWWIDWLVYKLVDWMVGRSISWLVNELVGLLSPVGCSALFRGELYARSAKRGLAERVSTAYKTCT